MLQKISDRINKKIGEIVIVGLLFLIIQALSLVPYINLFMLWFGWTLISLVIILLFKIPIKTVFIIIIFGFISIGMLLFLKFYDLAEQLALLFFNLTIYCATYFTIKNWRDSV